MSVFKKTSILDQKKKYLQIALNSTLADAAAIIESLPVSERIIVEAGTPLIKRYGEEGIERIKEWYEDHLNLGGLTSKNLLTSAYVVADLKTMDRGQTEVEIATSGGANAAIALGSAPVETLNSFLESCVESGLDSMIDMMNVEYPLAVLRQLKLQPTVVILHRGVDEEQFNKEKQLPLHEIRRIKANYDIMIAIAGGDTIREVQRAIFNDADIVVVWKSFYQNSTDTGKLAEEFLKQIK